MPRKHMAAVLVGLLPITLALVCLATGPPAQKRKWVSLSTPVRLTYDAGLQSAGFPSPALRVTVGGTMAWLLVDTGAGVHTLAAWFSRAANLPTSDSAGAIGQDSTGRKVPMRVARDFVLTLDDGRTLRIAKAAVADFPPEFEERGIGGLISPQLLGDSGVAASLDLRLPELKFEKLEEGIRRLGATKLNSAVVCSSPTSPMPNLLFAVKANVAGTAAVLTLDTGASVTTLARQGAAVNGLGRLEPDGFEMGVGGIREPVFRSPAVGLDFGAGARTMQVRVGNQTGGCGRDGLLGMDALRGCTLVLSGDAVAVSCQAKRTN